MVPDYGIGLSVLAAGVTPHTQISPVRDAVVEIFVSQIILPPAHLRRSQSLTKAVNSIKQQKLLLRNKLARRSLALSKPVISTLPLRSALTVGLVLWSRNGLATVPISYKMRT